MVASYRMVSRYSGVPIRSMRKALHALDSSGFILVRKVWVKKRGFEVTTVTFVNKLARLLTQRGSENEPVPASERNL